MSRRRWIFRGNPDRENRECSWATTTRYWLSVRRCVRCSRGRSDHPRKLCSRVLSGSPLTRPGSPAVSPEPGCSRDQKQPCAQRDGPGDSRDPLTGRGKTFDGDGGRDDSHRENVHDPDDQEDGHQTDAALAAVEADAQAMSPGRAGVGWQRTAAPGCLPAAREVIRLPRGELEGACQQDDRTDGDRGGARQRDYERIGGHTEHCPDDEVAHAHKYGQLAEAGLAVAP